MKNNKITFYLEFILGLSLILFVIFQASKNINAWFEVLEKIATRISNFFSK